MSFHVTMSSTLRGRDVQLFEVEYLGEAITSVAADVVRRLHEAGFKLKSVYVGSSKHWVAAKSMIGVHSMPLNNLGLKGLKDGDAQMFTFAVKVTNRGLQGRRQDVQGRRRRRGDLAPGRREGAAQALRPGL